MLTNITIRNFKCFKEVVVDLASPVVFIGPNDRIRFFAAEDT
jgi:AAA15 family ATPase/GTPase